jgi:cyclopropane-fatty-acyl-phospholipid synthase
MNRYEKTVRNIFSLVDIEINGSRPHDIQVHHPGFYQRFLKDGRLALGESYMDGWWDCEKIDAMVYHLMDKNLAASLDFRNFGFYRTALMAKIFPEGARSRSHLIGKRHYDIGNDLYEVMLDRNLIYSCAYWEAGARNLDEAQEAKMELICRKLKLRPGMTLLDVGCGWGGLARYAAQKHRVQVLGVSVSKEQVDYAKKFCDGWPVEIRFQDYRDVQGAFDRIVSVGMFEHVGKAYLGTFMATLNRILKEDGYFLLHTIGVHQYGLKNAWLNKYIFPGGQLPSLKDVARAMEGLFKVEDLHNIGPNYDPTLMAWYENFLKHWDQLKSEFDERFFRMWKYYLLGCAGAFRARQTQVWQFVLSKPGFRGRYAYEAQDRLI